MKEHESSPLALEYPPPDSYYLKQQHADTLDNDNTDDEANADTVYKELSLLAKFEAVVNEAGGTAAQPNSRPQSLSQPLPSSPIHVLLNGSGGRVSVLSSGAAVAAVEVDNSSNSGLGGSRGAGNLSVTQSDEPTNSGSNKSKPFQATFSTNTGGSSLLLTVETTNSLQQDAIPQDSDNIVAGDDGVDLNDDGCPPSDGSGGPTAAIRMCHGDIVTSGLSVPSERRASCLPVPTTHHHSQHAQLPPLQQQQQQNRHQQLTNPTDAEDNAISRDIHHRIDNEIIQSRMDIEYRRQTYYSTRPHLRLPPFPPAAARTPQSASKMAATRRPVSNMPPFDRRHKFARRDYTSPTYLEDYVLTRRGSINDKVWTTSLTPRATVLPFGLAIGTKKQELRGFKVSGAATSSVSESSPSSSSSWSRWLPDTSLGHEIHPPTEPGPVYGVNRPRFTHKYALYDVPFYGIENVEISSSRYKLLDQSNPSPQLEEAGDNALQDRRRGSSGNGVGTGGSSDGSGEAEGGGKRRGSGHLSDYREHIWSVAHEDEYGPETGAGAVEENRMLRERLKRAQRILPIVRSMPPAVGSSASGSGSGSGSGSTEAQQTQRFRGGVDLRIDVDHGSHVEMSQLTASSMVSSSTNSTNNHSVQFIPMGRHGRGHGHGQVPRRPRRPRPVSEGVYGPDTFQESLELIKYVPERPTGRWAKLMAIVRQHWKSWVFVGSISVAAIVVIVILLKKKGDDGGSKGMASAGQGGGDGGSDDPGFDGGKAITTMKKEPPSGGGRVIVTKTARPSSTRSAKATPTSTSTATSTSKSSAAPTSKAATARRTTTARRSTTTRASSTRPKVARTTAS